MCQVSLTSTSGCQELWNSSMKNAIAKTLHYNNNNNY